jgi:eukaryotic-like serine/threonine-protein kinase
MVRVDYPSEIGGVKIPQPAADLEVESPDPNAGFPRSSFVDPGMDNAPVDPLLAALRDSGHLSAEKVAAAERAFAECGGRPADLAERLNAAAVLTRYQYKKLQVGRAADLLFGPYLILDKIGEGGMGKVYRAVQLRMNRMVALKVVRQQLVANKTVLKRYEREAAAAAKLDHPNIVKLYDAELADGRYFLAMEYVEGLDLAKLVKQFGPLPYQEACEYIRQAALGLQHAHQQSLIHRDIKPSNLLVYGERALPGTNGKASLKILDMGLVRSILEEDAGQPDLTRDGTVVGTPDYMSPEQAKNSSTVTPQADIYSLGCTLYYLLTAKAPHPDGSPVEKLIKHQLDPFPDVRKLVPAVPVGLARVLAEMTAKRVSDRTPTADAVAIAIAPYTPNGDKFDFFSPTTVGPQSGGQRGARYETVDLAPTKSSPVSGSAVHLAASVAAAVASPTPSATRTGGSTAAPATTRTARPKAIPLPEPEPISAENLPVGEARRTPRSTGGTARMRKPGSKLAAKFAAKRRRFPVAAVVGCALAGILAVALVVLVFHKPTPPTPPTVEPPKPADPTPQPRESPFRDVADLLPDQTAAVLLSHPKAFIDRLGREARPSSSVTGTFDRRLRGRFLFDLRKVERVTVAFQGDAKGVVVAGEGGFVKPEFLLTVDEMPARMARVTKESGGALRLAFPLAVQPKNPLKGAVYSDVQGAVLPGPPVAYLLSDRSESLDRLLRRNAGRPADSGPAADVPPELLKDVQAVAPRSPLVYFAATGSYRLPAKGAWAKGETLAALGVSLLTVEVRLDQKFTVDLAVTGDTLEHVRDFLNVELPRRLKDWSPDLKPLAEAAVAVEPQLAAGGRPRMTLSVTLEWETVQAALETLLTPYANDR